MRLDILRPGIELGIIQPKQASSASIIPGSGDPVPRKLLIPGGTVSWLAKYFSEL